MIQIKAGKNKHNDKICCKLFSLKYFENAIYCEYRNT